MSRSALRFTKNLRDIYLFSSGSIFLVLFIAVIMLFAEYVDTKSALTLTVQLSKDYGDCGVTINQDSVALRTSLGAYRVEFSGLSIACVTCRNLEALSEEIMCCTFDATKKQSAHEPCKILSTVERLLVDGEALLCKFCQNDVAKIKHVKNFKLQPPAFSLEENCFASEESQFCHPDNSEEQETHCIDLQLIEAFPDPTSLSRSNGLHSGVEVLLSSELIELESFKEQSGKYLHCSRCLIALGRKLTIGSSDQYVLWANCLDVLTEELDVDGAFLRHIEKPLLNEMDFYAMFIASLVENQCYRVIISAITWHGCVDFMLLVKPLQLYSYRCTVQSTVQHGRQCSCSCNHVYLSARINGILVVRPYTPISLDEQKGYVDFVIKVYKSNTHPNFPNGGKMSQYLMSLPLNQYVDVRGPAGNLHYKGNGLFAIKPDAASPPRNYQVTYVSMVCGGSGITPMFQLLRYILTRKNDKTKLALVFANNTDKDIILRDELEDLQSKHPQRFRVWYTITEAPENWTYSTGYISEQILSEHIYPPGDDSLVLLCGPTPMVEFACYPSLAKLSYPRDRIFAY
ncbi:unnamed protein product [Dicrocoelium dendriticum]|nr:unnamed protein product [Dicrocoelium dendriticum]